MRKNPLYIVLFSAILYTALSCHSSYQSQSLQYQSYRISDSLKKDSATRAFLHPYWQSVNATMNDVVGIAGPGMEKKQPESAMGNFFSDALLEMATEKYQTKVDAAFINFGGLRLTQLPPGPVTTGKVFEIMPFDNVLVLQKLKGAVLQQFLDLTAARGGWPLAGLTMQIKDKKAVNVKIGGRPLDPSATYTIAHSDFIANGGDNADMLRNIPQISNGYLVRDAFLDYIKKRKSQGLDISGKEDNRVTNAQ